MTSTSNFIASFTFISDSVTKEMSAEEFIEFVQINRHVIKQSRFVPPSLGSHGLGKFIVEIEDGNLHLAVGKFGQ